MPTVEDTIADRETRYGDFAENARVWHALINTVSEASGAARLDDTKRAALMVILQKIARIVTGDPEYKDNWHDIGGYAKLAEDRCLDN